MEPSPSFVLWSVFIFGVAACLTALLTHWSLWVRVPVGILGLLALALLGFVFFLESALNNQH